MSGRSRSSEREREQDIERARDEEYREHRKRAARFRTIMVRIIASLVAVSFLAALVISSL